MEYGMRLVVADDEPALRELVSGCLERVGYRVTAVADGRQLVEACLADPPELIVSDVRMPHLDGLSAVAELARVRPVPTVLLSGSWDEGQVLLAEAMGVVPLSKPFRPLDLLDAMASACPPRPLRVLVADPDADTADSLRWLLEFYGCRVRIAHNDAATEADAEQFRPHLILVDGGCRCEFDVVRRIRIAAAGRVVRIVAHTGWTGENSRELARAAGCDQYLTKPADPEEFQRLFADVTLATAVASQAVTVG